MNENDIAVHVGAKVSKSIYALGKNYLGDVLDNISNAPTSFNGWTK